MPAFSNAPVPVGPHSRSPLSTAPRRSADRPTRFATCVVGLALTLGSVVARADARGAEVIDRAAANAIVAATDRITRDRRRDARRRPEELLVFARIGPGMTAADLGAGDGYTTELLARAVGPTGKVYGHNSPVVVERYVSKTWPERLARPVNANVVRVDGPIADPLPRSTRDIDVMTMIFTYHDTYLTRLGDFDHKLYLRRLYKMMAPGGRIIVVDHRAKPGARGPEVADDLHRIDEDLVKKDFEAAGFVLDATADYMSNADDPREAAFFDMDQPTDAFVHRWVKPKP